MSRHSIRVELPDLPGALAKVATVVSELNGDVVSVDVHEVDGNNAVDEMVVEFLTGLDPGELGHALDRSGAGRLLSCSPADTRADPVVEALRWAHDLAAAPVARATGILERVLAERVSSRRGVGGADRRRPRGRRRPPRAGAFAPRRATGGGDAGGLRRRGARAGVAPRGGRRRRSPPGRSRSSPGRCRCASPRPRWPGSTRWSPSGARSPNGGRRRRRPAWSPGPSGP